MSVSNARYIAAIVVAMSLAGGVALSGEGEALKLRASVIGSQTTQRDALTIELQRWSTDAERVPLVAALSAPTAAPPAPPAPTDGRAGRGGRGGRGAAPPPSPLARLTAAVKAAPTVGYIWGGGPTGYSIKYAWRSASAKGNQQVVLVTDRRLGAPRPLWPEIPGAAGDAEFTVIEMRLDFKGAGEAKMSFGTGVVTDSATTTLAIDGYDAAPAQLRVTR